MARIEPMDEIGLPQSIMQRAMMSWFRPFDGWVEVTYFRDIFTLIVHFDEVDAQYTMSRDQAQEAMSHPEQFVRLVLQDVGKLDKDVLPALEAVLIEKKPEKKSNKVKS